MNPFPHLDDRKERKASKGFASPTRDQLATGRGCQGGDEHGIGFRTPYGKMSARPLTQGPIPMESKCFDPNEVA